MIRITETARDAMQGIKQIIPTELKIRYINVLLQAGFDTVDCGSFVSKRVIPQMADSVDVMKGLVFPKDVPELMMLVVNMSGVEMAMQCTRVQCLSYPYSVSPTFLQRNLHSDESKALESLKNMIDRSKERKFEWVVYLSMALGNPYGDDWSVNKVIDGAAKLYELGIRRMPLSDILGEASADLIFDVYKQLIPCFPDVDFGLHLHTKPTESAVKIEAAYSAGVRSFETVLNGFGGCPTAASTMVGNLSTQSLLQFCERNGLQTKINQQALHNAIEISSEFAAYI